MAVLAIILLNGTTADANEVMSDLYPLYQDMAPVNVAAGNKTGTGRFVLDTEATLQSPTINNGTFTGTSTFTGTVILPGTIGQFVPIGTIIPWQDYGILTFDTTIWKYCDGTAIVGGPLNGQLTQDMSASYLIGFGTAGGGDIDTAPWAVGVVGNALSQIAIAHTHTTGAHDHGAGSFAAAAHNHTAPAITGLVNQSAPGVGYELQIGGGQNMNLNPSSPLQGDHAHDGFGNTGTAGPHAVSGTSASGGSGAVSSSNLSATQDIRPRSIRVRYLIRYL